jgi:hypothetical protein
MPFRELLLNNFRRKLFALLLAVLVWMTIHFVEVRKQPPAPAPAPAPPPSTNAPSLNP